MRVGIMVPDLVANDAVGNDGLGMYLSLMRRGVEAYIFTQNGTARSPLTIYHYADVDLLLSSPDDLVIYHYCIVDEPALKVLRKLTCRIVLRYHNVTPAHFFAPFSVEFSRGARAGREMLAEIVELPLTAIMGASIFNTAELAAIGHSDLPTTVVPPFHRVDELVGLPDDPAIVGEVSAHWFNILAVGRPVPNKALHLMLEAFARASRSALRNVHLHLVGGRDPRLAGYSAELDKLIQLNALGAAVTWHGSVDGRTLATLYRQCDLFWTTSLHEGFCLPVAEAMAFGLPVLSSRQGALPETCGSAALFADTMDEYVGELTKLAQDEQLRVQLGRAGKRRFNEHFRYSRIEARFFAALDQVEEQSKRRVIASTLSSEGDWFDLPKCEKLITAALSVSDPLSPTALTGRDRRRDFVDWVLRDGWRRSPEVAALVRSEDFRRYASDIEVPADLGRLTPMMRLRWRFDRAANTGFGIDSPQDVHEFARWYQADAEEKYAFSADW